MGQEPPLITASHPVPPHLAPGLGAGDLVAVDDGAVEGGHEDDGHDAGRQQRVQDLLDYSALKKLLIIFYE